jgi:hypothetical protein
MVVKPLRIYPEDKITCGLYLSGLLCAEEVKGYLQHRTKPYLKKINRFIRYTRRYERGTK